LPRCRTSFWAAVRCVTAPSRVGRASKGHRWEGLQGAPKGVHLDSAKGIAENAKAIYLQAGLSRAMPPADLSFMERTEREVIRRWFRAAMEG